MSYFWIATTDSARTRIVFCEKCDEQYVYDMVVIGMGTTANTMRWRDNTAEEAMRNARKDLKEELKYACKHVPCPECAHVQKHMIRTAQDDLVENGYFTAYGIFGIGVIYLIVAKCASFENTLVPILSIFGLAALVYGVSYLVGVLYDPNAVSKEKRYRLAEARCKRRPDYEKDLADDLADEFDRSFKKLRKEYQRGDTPVFEVPFWADRDQVREGVNRNVMLPSQEKAKVPLAPDMRNGDETDIQRTVDGVPVVFRCILNIYSETRVKK